MPALLDGVRRRSPRPNTRGRALRSRHLYDRDVLSARFQTTKRPLRQGNRPARPQFGRGGMSVRDAAPPPSDRSPDAKHSKRTALLHFSNCPAGIFRMHIAAGEPASAACHAKVFVDAIARLICSHGFDARSRMQRLLVRRIERIELANLAVGLRWIGQEHPYYSANQLNCKERAQPRGRICAKGRHPLDFQPAPC